MYRNLERMRLDFNVRAYFDARWKYERDLRSRIKYSQEECFKEGLEIVRNERLKKSFDNGREVSRKSLFIDIAEIWGIKNYDPDDISY